jgi:hypothetical protein
MQGFSRGDEVFQGAPSVGGFGGHFGAPMRIDSGGNSSAVERQPSKLGVAGSNPVSRSRVAARSVARRGPGFAVRGEPRNTRNCDCDKELNVTHYAHVAQTAERVLGKDEVSGSIPDMGSIGLRAVGRRGLGPRRSRRAYPSWLGRSSAR